MLKKMVNHALVDLNILPIDPMLIKSGQATVSGVDMSFVRTYMHGTEPEPFIPGSSLKGVIRSYGEKICRSLKENPVPVCLPYLERDNEQNGDRNQASCGSRIKNFLRKTEQDE
ncbi:MAG: RAMP superfamily CRISPR-associated protein, partial [Thermodesulfobacteriota bacterium]